MFKSSAGGDNLEGIYHDQPQADGTLTREFTVDAARVGTLVVVVEFGDALNSIKISNLKLEEKAETPADPYFTFNNTNVVDHFYDDVVGSVTVDGEDSHILNLEVTSDPANVWSAKVEITTEYQLEVDKTYVVTITIDREDETENFEVLFKKDLGNDNLEGVYNQSEGDGTYTREFTYTGESDGVLYVVIQFGGAVNSIKISNLKLELKNN